MNKRIISGVLSLSVAASMLGGFATTAFAANAPKYQTQKRQMEQLNRGLIAVKTEADTRGQTVNGVYLSWRLLGTESLENQAFDIYKNGTKIHTTGAHDATCYIDTTGTVTDQYKVVRAGESADSEPAVTPNPSNHYAKPSEVGNGNSLRNSFSYVDIPLMRPDPVKSYDGDMSYYYTLDKDHEGGANDASVGDLDGDGDYEMILKWDPTNSKDTVNTGTSGNVYIDAYEITTATDNFKWRIDLGQSIRAGAHDAQILVYDFDGDGKSEVVTQTAAGSKDSQGRYVTEVGDTEEIRNTDNTNIQLSKGHNIGADFYTVFDGDTGVALYTTAGIPLGATNGSAWGDSELKRAHRFLGAVAYLDGVHPSIVMCRGYYNRAVVRAYTWDGAEMTLLWEHVGASKGAESLYGQGNHNLSVADVDNDGKDEIVYGSATLDDDGKVIGNTLLGHGDAMHVSDFNNDGIQEVFSVKEDSEGWYNKYAEDLRVAATGEHFWEAGKICWTTGINPDTNKPWDNGRGVMDNIDDDYAKANPDALAIGWSSGFANAHNLKGDDLKAKPSGAGKGSFDNFLVYWDGDLGRELLDHNIIQKYDAANGWTKRFYGPSDGYTLVGATTNNYTKRNPSLVADLWGDWREEVIMPYNKTSEGTAYLRIFTSTLPTDYRLTTLMHDSQYRMAIAWQNVGYNQPPHTSYYVGSVALATDDSGNTLNYLAPATAYTNVTYEQPESVAVTGVKLSESEVTVEKGESVTISAILEPETATKKSVTWTSSDEKIATVANGTIKGMGEGEAIITATTRDGGFTATCKVTVYQKHATGVRLSASKVEVGTGGTAQIKAYVTPDDATDKSVTWTSADESIATVDKNGVVTGVIDGEGSTTVTATTVDGGYTASCKVNVFPLATTDETGSESFAFATENTDANTTLNASANSAALTHADSNSGATVQKKFAAYSDNKATLTFRLTTGGQKYDGSNWNWDGHEYSMGLRFLDTKGNNILTITQPYATSAGTLMSKIGDKDATGLIKGWTEEMEGSGNVQGSAKRWNVTMVFDYDKDICSITITGTDSTWEVENGKYSTTFSLNGASFETMQLYTTKDGEGTIKAVPNLANVSYTRTVALIPRDKVSVTGYEGNEVSYKGVITNKYDSVAVIGAVYDNGTLVEVKSNTVENPTVVEAVDGESFTGKLAFDSDIQGKEVKVYLWDSLSGMQPLSSKATYNVPAADATPTPEPTPTPVPTPTPTPTPTPIPMDVIYERGTTTAWSDADLTDWTKSGSIASPVIDATNGLYIDTNMTGTVTKTFEVSEGAVVTYKANIYTGSSTGRESNYAYYKFGDKVTIGYNNSYNLFYSLDGGTTYNGTAIKNAKNASSAIEVQVNTNANTLVSLKVDGKVILENVSLGAGSTYNSVTMGFLRAGSVSWTMQLAMKNIEVLEYVDKTVYRTVTYEVDGNTTTEAVVDGGKVAQIPATDNLGYIFKGWSVNGSETLITTEELQALAITADTTITAVYDYDTSYARSIAKVEFVDAPASAITYPAEEGAKSEQAYTIKVTADTDDDITADCTFAWDLVGNENDDGYATMDETVTASTNTINITQGGDSCFGYVGVTATYTKNENAEPMSAQTPFALITNAKADNQILPAAGYPVSADYYTDELVGYVGTKNDYTSGYDIVLNNWCIVGSNAARDYKLVEEAGKKAIMITNVGGDRGGSGASTVGTMAFPTQTQQYVVDTTIKFSDNARIGVWEKTPNNTTSSEWTVSYAAGVLTAGDQTISGLSADEYYRVVVSSDPVNKLYSVYVYNMEGTLVGSAEGVTGDSSSGKYLCVDGGFPVYVNSLQAYIPTVDSVTIVADNDSVRVPENETDAASEVALEAICKTADGIKLTGAVEWSLAQEYQGVTLEEGVQNAVLKVANGAAGTVDVIATMGAKSFTKTITLVNSSNVVAFTQSKSSITIPFAEEEDVTATYKADTITPDDADGIGDATIEYSFLDKTGVVELTELPSGITSNIAEGVLTLTVTSEATPAIFYIKAVNSEGLSTKVQVNVHGLSYQFGTTVEEGYTQVTSATLYTDTLGYGFESTAGLTDAETSVTGTDAYRFKAKVPNGNYSIEVNTTSANMYSEIVDEVVAVGALMPGITKTGSSFNVAVCDGVLDLKFDAASSITSLSIAQMAAKEEREKPAIYSIGDSTTKANTTGARSWGECVTDGLVTVPDAFSSYFNHGMAGRDSDNFYYQGRIEAVLLDVHPGDYVTVNMGINSRSENINEGAAYPILMDTYYVKAILERGAIPVIVTATPQGPVGNYASNYNSSTGMFDVDRGTGARNGELRKLAQKYDLNIIELGYWGNDTFSALTMDDVTAYNSANGTEYTTVLQLVQSWYPDHNHYAAPLGTQIGDYIFDCLDKIEAGSTDFNQANDPHINEQ